MKENLKLLSVCLAICLALVVLAGGYAAWTEVECHSLYECAEKGAVRQLRERIRQGEDVNARDNMGYTALQMALLHGHHRCAETLLEAGADLTRSGSQALHDAVSGGNVDCVKVLLRAGVNPNAADGSGYTALMRAAAFGRDDCVTELLKAGADPMARDARGMTARDHALQGPYSRPVPQQSCARLLEEAEAQK